MTRDRLEEMHELSKISSVSDSVVVSVEGSEDQRELLDLLDKIGPLYDKLKVSGERSSDVLIYHLSASVFIYLPLYLSICLFI